jgi:hypothetical protein
VTKKSTKCAHCGEPFPINGRGRPRLYCGAHRQNAYHRRRIAQIQRPSERRYRLLVEDLKRLVRFNTTRIVVPGLLGKSHKHIRARVVTFLNDIAPESFYRPSEATNLSVRDFDEAIGCYLDKGRDPTQLTRTGTRVKREIQKQLSEIGKRTAPDASNNEK